MILVRRDTGLIPKKVLDVAARAQSKLEALPPDQRSEFIKKKSHIWRAFGRYLAQMSFKKCWYSEALDLHSFHDIDHFRPKLEAKRADGTVGPGYDWLAFSWQNFRYSATCANRLLTNDDTGEVDGKGTWFPLLPGSLCACWDDRCEDREFAVLLDPIVEADVDLIEVKSDGRMGARKAVVGTSRFRVQKSCQHYGLNLPNIKEARLRIMRDVQKLVEIILETVTVANSPAIPMQAADELPIPKQCEMLTQMTESCSAYSKAARAALESAGFSELCASSSGSRQQAA